MVDADLAINFIKATKGVLIFVFNAALPYAFAKDLIGANAAPIPGISISKTSITEEIIHLLTTKYPLGSTQFTGSFTQYATG